jgi:hypothetical protein
MDADEFAGRMRMVRGLVDSLDREMDRCQEQGPAREAAALRAFTSLDRLKAQLTSLELDVFAGDMERVQESLARVNVAGEILAPIERGAGR